MKKNARLAGILYLVIFICAGFSEGFVRGTLVVPGDAVATAQQILDSEWLFRLGFVADLVAFVADAIVAVLLYMLLRPVSKTLSLTAATLRLIAHPAIGSLNLLNHYNALQFLKGNEYMFVFDNSQLQAQALFALDAHGTGYLIAGVFFGVHLFLLGWLLYRSELFPNVLGILVAIASFGYLFESFGTFLYPAYEEFYTLLVTISAVIGEFALTIWLIIKGVRSIKTS